MKSPVRIIAAALIAITATNAFAQMQMGANAELPPICTVDAMQGMGSANEEHQMSISPAHDDLMMGMDQMNEQMMLGMSASDIDVAFVCGMIPHHQGAINMAKAELAHGDDPWAKELALKVITAQEQEIADMLEWLAQQSN